ncbi:hypothetical protein ACFQL2_14470 [Halosegnis marinus]
MSNGTISRRRLLAAGGLVGAGALAGCLNRVASAVTNTGASPRRPSRERRGRARASSPSATRT